MTNPHAQPLASSQFFGTTPDGKPVYKHRLVNKNGMELHLIDFGATITAIKIPLENGTLLDVVLGFDTLQHYIDSFASPARPYFGATVGRYAGRINQGLFVLNGKKIQLNKNNNEHALHGGIVGFSQAVWTKEEASSNANSLTFTYLSVNNEEHFPGNLLVSLRFTLTDDNEIQLYYQATSDDDTIINLTHHSYFNLEGQQADLKNQYVFVNSDTLVATTPNNIPTGLFTDLTNHPFKFDPAQKCPQEIDSSFVLRQNDSVAATLSSTVTGLQMEVYTDQPAVHIYVGGNCFNAIVGKENVHYHSGSGICFETQNYADAPNHAHFPNAVLKKGERYQQHTRYKFQKISL